MHLHARNPALKLVMVPRNDLSSLPVNLNDQYSQTFTKITLDIPFFRICLRVSTLCKMWAWSWHFLIFILSFFSPYTKVKSRGKLIFTHFTSMQTSAAVFSRGEPATTLPKNVFLRKMLFHLVTLQAGSEERIRVQLVEALHRLPFSANNKLRKQETFAG